jgi:nucleotide-binding universal stress UspA family protein
MPGSVSTAALSATHCPMVVVPARLAEVASGGPVVLGCDGSARTLEATAFAFACAARLEVPLVVVNAGRVASAAAREGIAAMLSSFERVYPGVDVAMRVMSESLPAALCSAAKDPTLIVVGDDSGDPRARPGPHRRLELLHRARRPVAFVGTGATPEPDPAASDPSA